MGVWRVKREPVERMEGKERRERTRGRRRESDIREGGGEGEGRAWGRWGWGKVCSTDWMWRVEEVKSVFW